MLDVIREMRQAITGFVPALETYELDEFAEYCESVVLRIDDEPLISDKQVVQAKKDMKKQLLMPLRNRGLNLQQRRSVVQMFFKHVDDVARVRRDDHIAAYHEDESSSDFDLATLLAFMSPEETDSFAPMAFA